MELTGVNFNRTGLKGTSFANAILHNVSFKTEVKYADFTGAKMDKMTYALLKGLKAKLDSVEFLD